MTRSRSTRSEKKGGQKRSKENEGTRPESPEFFGFSNSDIPQPILIKTEPVEDGDSEDCVVVEVTKASKPLPAIQIKKEKEDDDDLDTFHGFSLADLPKPIVIKEELIEEETATVTELQGEKVENPEKEHDLKSDEKEQEPENIPVQKIEEVVETTEEASTEDVPPLQPEPASNIPGDDLLDEFESSAVEADRENNDPAKMSKVQSASPEIKIKKIVNSPRKLPPSTPDKSIRIGSAKMKTSPLTASRNLNQSPIKPSSDENVIIVQQGDGKQIVMQQPRFVTKPSLKNYQRPAPSIQVVRGEGSPVQRAPRPLPKKIQLIDENGEKIELITQEAEGDFDTGDETDEDHEFTVVVEENDAGEVTNITGDIGHNNAIEADSIEDIIAQFEHETSNGSQAKTKQQEAKEIENDLIRRKRNIDLIAKETALLGRKPIEPEKYYNLPVEDEDEDEEEEGDLEDDEAYCPSPPKIQKAEAKTHVLEDDSSEEVKLACGMAGCDLVFDNRGALKRHRAESHPELEEFKPVDLEPDDPDRAADMTVACPVCERKFKHKNTCTVHIKTNHLGWSKRKLFECPECQRPFDNKKAVEAHRESVHLGIRTVCPLCDKPVTRLDLHVRMVHTDLPEWPCPDCGKKFKRKFDLNRHRVTVHLGVRNFPCDLCGKRFADMKDMNRHKNAVHYGMKIKWNSRKYKEKKGQLKPKKPKTESTPEVSHSRKRNNQQQQQQLEETSVTYIETVETSGEEIISMEGLEGSTVILENGTVLQSHLEAVKGAPGEPQVFIEADPDGHGAYRFVVMTEEEAGTVLEAADIVEVR